MDPSFKYKMLYVLLRRLRICKRVTACRNADSKALPFGLRSAPPLVIQLALFSLKILPPTLEHIMPPVTVSHEPTSACWYSKNIIAIQTSLQSAITMDHFHLPPTCVRNSNICSIVVASLETHTIS